MFQRRYCGLCFDQSEFDYVSEIDFVRIKSVRFDIDYQITD